MNNIVKINGNFGVGLTGSPTHKIHVEDYVLLNDNAAIYGKHAISEGYGIGIEGEGNYKGIKGTAISNTSYPTFGGDFTSSNTGTSIAYGVKVDATSNSGNSYGIYAQASTTSGTAYAGYFNGDVHITGTLSKANGTFKIDHPADPENKYLIHSFVESPEMKNVYDGVVTLDNNGKAVIELPSYFGILNENFRYLLTAIGAPAPNIYIATEIANNQFEIAGGTPGQKISWQVTGVRKDPFAKQHPIIPEQEKSANDKGKYLNPKLYGQPESKAIGYSERK